MNSYFNFPMIDPIIFSIGPISLHWYGAMYLFGVIGASLLANRRIKKDNLWSKQQVENLLFWGFIALFIGGRVGYILFYNIKAFIADPIILFKVWEGGMSFHGGLIGAIVAMYFFAKKQKKTFFEVADFIAPLIPIGLMFGRFGNFINGELWGRITDLSIGMRFPTAKMADLAFVKANPEWNALFIAGQGLLPRHPSQLYEMILEGIVLFIILNLYVIKKRSQGSVAGLFLIFYGLFRTLIEFVREPDEQLGLFWHLLTMGQLLSAIMIIFGCVFIFKSKFNSHRQLKS